MARRWRPRNLTPAPPACPPLRCGVGDWRGRGRPRHKTSSMAIFGRLAPGWPQLVDTSRWIEFKVEVPSPWVEAVVAALDPMYPGGAVVEHTGTFGPEESTEETIPGDVTIKGYLPADDEALLQVLEAGLHRALASISPAPPFTFSRQEIKERDWATAWHSYFRPIRSGSVVVAPPWSHPRIQPGHVLVRIQPGMAFGTGSHATTRLCLMEMERHIGPGSRMIDLGTGSGVLAIAAAKLGASRVLALDIDESAVGEAGANAAANGAEGIVQVALGSLDATRVLGFGPAQLLVANLTSATIMELAPAIFSAIAPGGWLVASGIGDQRIGNVVGCLRGHGFRVARVRRKGEWRLVAAQRPA